MITTFFAYIITAFLYVGVFFIIPASLVILFLSDR